MNVKHVLGELNSAAEGTEVLVKFGSRCYRAIITDLLEWQPPKRHRKSKDTGQPPQSSAKEKEALKGSARKTKASKSSAAKKSTALKHSVNATNNLLWLRSGSLMKSAGKAPDSL